MSSMRKAIGKTLQASKQTIPHFYIEATVDAAAMMDFYRLHKGTLQVLRQRRDPAGLRTGHRRVRELP